MSEHVDGLYLHVTAVIGGPALKTLRQWCEENDDRIDRETPPRHGKRRDLGEPGAVVTRPCSPETTTPRR
jgi:hypothetical protein